MASMPTGGLAVLGAFIFGMDGDTPDKLLERTSYMLHQPVDVMQTTFLTPLPGTRLFERYCSEDRLLYTDFPADWGYYDMTKVVHRPRGMTAEELEQAGEACNRRLHALPVLVGKALGTILRTRNIMAGMFAWGSNLNYRRASPLRRNVRYSIKRRSRFVSEHDRGTLTKIPNSYIQDIKET